MTNFYWSIQWSKKSGIENLNSGLDNTCGDRPINRPIGFRIDSGLLGPWPIQGCVSVREHHTPRQYASEDDRVRGRSGRGLTAIRSQN